MKNFVSFEGGEGSGKSTQAKLLFDSIKKITKRVILTREPGGSVKIDSIRKLIVSSDYNFDPITELFLINAARNEHIKKIILPSIKVNKIVICDRFVDSTYAYQVFGKGVDKSIFEQLNEIIIKKVLPEVTFLIDINPIIGIERSLKRKNNEIKFENYKIDYHKKVRKAFNKISKINDRIIKIDGKQTKRDIHRIIVDYFNKKKILKQEISYSL